ncbi:hypothetical protein T265_15645, partial [Opisthorchis viverrini]
YWNPCCEYRYGDDTGCDRARRPRINDRKVRGLNSTSISRLSLSRRGQPGSIPAPVQASDGMEVRHRNGVAAEQTFANSRGFFQATVNNHQDVIGRVVYGLEFMVLQRPNQLLPGPSYAVPPNRMRIKPQRS